MPAAAPRPRPAAPPAEIRGNLTARIAEAEAARWLGELEGLKVSLATVTDKLQSMDAMTARQPAVTDLGMPGFTRSAPASGPQPDSKDNPDDGRPAPASARTALRACARGIYPVEAGIDLLIGHGSWLDRDDFTRHITTAEHGRPGSKAAHAAIDWTAAATALDTGTLPCSGGERRIFRLAASLAAGLPVNLRDALTGLDEHNLERSRSAPSCTPQATVRLT